MAGDWIKMRTGLAQKPQAFQIAEMTSLSVKEVVATLYEVACWFRSHGKEGKHFCEPSIVSLLVGVPGFGEAMISVGWMQAIDGALVLRGFTDISSIRTSISANIRKHILASGKCAKCGSVNDLEIDHIVSVKKGGRTVRENLQVLCRTCNRRKGAK